MRDARKSEIDNMIKISRKYTLDEKTGVVYETGVNKKTGGNNVVLIPVYRATIYNNQISIELIGSSKNRKLALGTVRKIHEVMLRAEKR